MDASANRTYAYRGVMSRVHVHVAGREACEEGGDGRARTPRPWRAWRSECFEDTQAWGTTTVFRAIGQRPATDEWRRVGVGVRGVGVVIVWHSGIVVKSLLADEATVHPRWQGWGGLKLSGECFAHHLPQLSVNVGAMVVPCFNKGHFCHIPCMLEHAESRQFRCAARRPHVVPVAIAVFFLRWSPATIPTYMTERMLLEAPPSQMSRTAWRMASFGGVKITLMLAMS